MTTRTRWTEGHYDRYWLAEKLEAAEARLDEAVALLREIVPPEGLLKERDDFDAEGWLPKAHAFLADHAAEPIPSEEGAQDA